MTISKLKVRYAKDISEENEVCNFKFLQGLHYPAVSIECLFSNRNKGYYEIIERIIKISGLEPYHYSNFFYSELDGLIEDSKLNRYKGFWKLKKSQGVGFEWLSKKHQLALRVGGKLKLVGYSLINNNELQKLISILSYKGMNFYSYIFESEFNSSDFFCAVSSGCYKDSMEYIIEKKGLVFILLGDEDYKTSEVVVISNTYLIDTIYEHANRLSYL